MAPSTSTRGPLGRVLTQSCACVGDGGRVAGCSSSSSSSSSSRHQLGAKRIAWGIPPSLLLSPKPNALDATLLDVDAGTRLIALRTSLRPRRPVCVCVCVCARARMYMHLSSTPFLSLWEVCAGATRRGEPRRVHPTHTPIQRPNARRDRLRD